MENEKENIKNEIKKELQEFAPKLGALQKPDHHLFSVPENYFEEFPFKVKDKIDARKAARAKNWADVQRYLMPRFAPAIVALAVIMLLSVFLLWNNTPDTGNNLASETSKQENYYLENIDEDLLVEGLISMNIPAAENKLLENGSKTNVLENYIIEEDYEESILIEEL